MSKKMPYTKQVCLQVGRGNTKTIFSSSISISEQRRRNAKCLKTLYQNNKAELPEMCPSPWKLWSCPVFSPSIPCLTLPWKSSGLIHGIQSRWLHVCHQTYSKEMKLASCMMFNNKLTHARNTEVNLVVRSKETATQECLRDIHSNCVLRTSKTNWGLHMSRSTNTSLKLSSSCSYEAKLLTQKSKFSKHVLMSHCLSHPIGIPSRSIKTSSHPDLVELSSVDDFTGPTLTLMTGYLRKNKIGYKIGYTCLILQCPFCEKQSSTEEEKSNGENNGKKNVYINKTTGWTSCQCGKAKGSWKNFEESMVIMNKQTKSRKSAKSTLPALPLCDDVLHDGNNTGKDTEKTTALWNEAEEVSQCDKDYLTGLREKFPLQRITEKTLERFQVRVDKSKGTLLLPVSGDCNQSDHMLGVIVLDIEKNKDHHKKVVETHFAKHGSMGLFGYNLLKPGTSEVILTESVLDALAVHQETSQAVLSLPHGSAMLPQQVLPLLEQFTKVTLWFSNDMRSWEACKQFANKLNSKRCHLIRPLETNPSPLAALNHGINPKTIIKKAVPVSHKFITSFRALRQEVLGELCHADQVAGVKWKRFQQLNKLLKGHRRGELTVFTGPTGSGKTTFMAEYSLDLCMQGVNTLWGSFEIQNVRLAKVMLTQFSGFNLSQNLDKFDESADKFELLPLYFMAFHGQQSLKKVLEAMSHAAYVHDIQHVIVDNLQFMVGYSDKQTVIDRFTVYDNFIAAFRRFATVNNCHVTLVIHPRKERETDELHTSSIFGSAKASQEADNVLILQDQTFTKPKSRKYIQIAKNRFDGECGRMPLSFNKNSLTMSQVTAPQKKTKKSKQDSKTGESEEKPSFESSLEDFFEEYSIGEDELGFKE